MEGMTAGAAASFGGDDGGVEECGMSCAGVGIGSAAGAISDVNDSRGGSGWDCVSITDLPLERVSEDEWWCDGSGWAPYEVVAVTSRIKARQKHTQAVDNPKPTHDSSLHLPRLARTPPPSSPP